MKTFNFINPRLLVGLLHTLFFSGTALAQSTFYVNDNSMVGDVYTTATGSNSNPGTSAAPFATINYAIGAAAPGDIIMVDAGTYAEHVLISKSIDLRGAKYGQDARTRDVSSGESILDGSTLTGPVYDAIKIANAVSGVIIDGFEIANYAGSGLNGDGNAISSYCMGASTTGASNVTIMNNYMHELAYNAIMIGSQNYVGTSMVMQSGFSIKQNRISGYTYAGIELTNTNNSQVMDNQIDAPVLLFNDPGDAGVAIEIASRSRARAAAVSNVNVSGNVVNGAFPSGSRAAINLLSRAYQAGSNASLSGITVDNNTISGAINVRAAVLAVAEARNAGPASISSLAVTANTLTGNSNGMVVQDYLNGGLTATHSNITVIGNSITNSVSNAFLVQASTAATGILLNDNILTGNGTYAAKNDGTDTLNATCNWYGSTNYSTVAGQVSGGNVIFVPYLVSGTDNAPAVPGFQPLPGSCIGTTANVARAYYTGMTFASTSGSNSSTATVTLSATIKDLCAVQYDYCPGGDIATAFVRFVNRELPSSDPGYYLTSLLPVGLVQAGSTYVGTVTSNVTFNIGTADARQYMIGIVVSGGYTRDDTEDDAIVTISKPLTGFITGGGHITLATSGGMAAGDTGTYANFGFSVKYNNKMTNLQGSANIIYRRMESDGLHIYQIKSISMTSLSVSAATASAPARAVFSCKAIIRDVTVAGSPLVLDGNATLQVNMIDMGEPGTMDAIAFTVWNKSGGLWFSSNWDGTSTVQQLLSGGNLKVHPSAIKAGNVSNTLQLVSSSATNTTVFGQSVTFTASIIENNNAKPTGAIVFYDGVQLLGYAPVNSLGTAVFTTTALAVGSHSITAYYGGDTKFAASTSGAVTHTVTSLRVTDASAGQSVDDLIRLTVFNNPSSHSFGILVEESIDGGLPVTIRITTLSGQMMEMMENKSAGVRYEIGEGYAAGIYLATIQYAGHSKTVRLVKMDVK